MERFVEGDVVVIPFPFSDLSDSKRRPALVLKILPGDDIILCQITSQNLSDKYSIKLLTEDFDDGGLVHPSNIRPNRIFTAYKNIILKRIGKLKKEKLRHVIVQICTLLKS
jgi:mRNA interferase MazF